MTRSILVVDVGTSGVRGAVVRPDATVTAVHHREVLPTSPAPGLVEFDPAAMATAALDVARAALAEAGPVAAVGITNQRASTVVWDRRTGEPVGPGLGWQDLRTVGDCLVHQANGLHLAPNESATKLSHLLDAADPDRTRADAGDLCFGTVDTWIAWHLSGGALHVTDLSNAAVTGLVTGDASGWNPKVLDMLRIPESVLPTLVDTSGSVGTADALDGAPPITALVGDQQASLAGQSCVVPGRAKVTFGTGAMLDMLRIPESVLPALVDTSGSVGTADALDGAPPITALVGDQQASLAGQSCVVPGRAKVTFGTGAMLDLCLGAERPTSDRQAAAGTFPIVAWRRDGQLTWGTEAVMLAAGTNVEWLRDDLGVIASAEESDAVAAACDDTGGVVYVPALLGLGTPKWDYGARGTLLGVTRGTGRPELVRAVLEGVAQRAADLLEATEADSGLSIGELRVDGGMSGNATFVQAVADATQRRVEVSPEREATTLGAGFLAGLAVGTWSGWDDVVAAWVPREVVEPARELDRSRWAEAIDRATAWFPELSAIKF